MVELNDYSLAIIGGCLIAFASSLNLLLKGRISGISGILFGVITREDILWKFCFMLGLLLSSTFWITFLDSSDFDSVDAFTGNLSLLGFVISGFLVGLGTKLANGCTSGHGVCGLPRFSKRSIVACAIFCGTGVFTATFRHQVPFLEQGDFVKIAKTASNSLIHLLAFLLIASLTFLEFVYIIVKKLYEQIYDYFISLTCGILFGIGLIVSGMVKRTKVINFLDLSSNFYDPSLLFVLCSAAGLNIILFYLIINKKKSPVFASKMNLPSKSSIDLGVIFGSIFFGIGWGISGLCPGPLLTNIFNYLPHTPAFFVSLVLGQLTAKRIQPYFEQTI